LLNFVLPDIKLANSTDNIFADFIRDWTTKETIDKLKIKIKYILYAVFPKKMDRVQ
jgi:hypothetical protein